MQTAFAKYEGAGNDFILIDNREGRCFTLFAEHRGIGGETKFFDAADGLHTARIRRLKGTSGEIEQGMIAVREIRTGDGW